MWSNPQGTAEGTKDLVTITEEILNGKLHFLCNSGAYFEIFCTKYKTISTLWIRLSSSLDLHKMLDGFSDGIKPSI